MDNGIGPPASIHLIWSGLIKAERSYWMQAHQLILIQGPQSTKKVELTAKLLRVVTSATKRTGGFPIRGHT